MQVRRRRREHKDRRLHLICAGKRAAAPSETFAAAKSTANNDM
jgi:hypothetical protein